MKEKKEKEKNYRDWGVWESFIRGFGMVLEFLRIGSGGGKFER